MLLRIKFDDFLEMYVYEILGNRNDFGGIPVWYVMQVRTGTEENIRQQCMKKIGKEVLEYCFIPYYEKQRRFRGEWTTLKEILFPGYLFVATEEIEKLYKKMKTVIGFTRLLGTGQEIVPLTEKEQNFIKKFIGEKYIVEMSKGIIERLQVRVMYGPLMGMEGYIKKIDRHKRKAWLELELFGRRQIIQVGLEIVAKS